jgi:cysteine-rich repeat protein
MAALCAAPRAACGHGTAPPDLAFWGPFGKGTVRCLRKISYGARRCFEEVLAVQSECRGRRLAGQPCDDAGREALIAAAHARAAGVVTDSCSGGQLTELRYAGFGDAQADILNTCVLQTEAVLSLLYPINASGTDPTVRQCVLVAAGLGRKLARHALVDASRAFDRIAARIIGPSVKFALVNASQARAQRAKQGCAARLLAECPQFEAIYGRTTADWAEALVRRNECTMLATYYQTSISCPAPVCGNGIKEAGEGCDDGNQVHDDRCSNFCGIVGGG